MRNLHRLNTITWRRENLLKYLNSKVHLFRNEASLSIDACQAVKEDKMHGHHFVD